MNYKKIIGCSLSLLCVVSLAACSVSQQSSSPTPRQSVQQKQLTKKDILKQAIGSLKMLKSLRSKIDFDTQTTFAESNNQPVQQHSTMEIAFTKNPYVAQVDMVTSIMGNTITYNTYLTKDLMYVKSNMTGKNYMKMPNKSSSEDSNVANGLIRLAQTMVASHEQLGMNKIGNVYEFSLRGQDDTFKRTMKDYGSIIMSEFNSQVQNITVSDAQAVLTYDAKVKNVTQVTYNVTFTGTKSGKPAKLVLHSVMKLSDFNTVAPIILPKVNE